MKKQFFPTPFISYFLSIALLCFGFTTMASAQNIANYAFTPTGGTYTALTTPNNPSFSSGDF